ncbi:MAG: hypothetical protein ACYCXW_05205 [Solirubrobacteraceae bacterium]
MSELSPRMLALKAELSQAIRRDHRRRQRRVKTARAAALSATALLALSSTALAAGQALGLIELGGGATAARVSRAPSSGPVFVMGFTGCQHGECSSRRPYVYRVSGGRITRSFGGITCGASASRFTPGVVYVSSSRELDGRQLRGAIAIVGHAGRRSRSELPRGTMIEIQGCQETNVPLHASTTTNQPTKDR